MKPAENYILNKPDPYKSILLHLQSVIEQTLPHVELKYKWNIPCYYSGKSPICYLNASLKKGFVDVGFWSSAHLTKHVDKLVVENRKVVKSLRYTTLVEIDNTVLVEILQEAYALKNKGFYKQNNLK